MYTKTDVQPSFCEILYKSIAQLKVGDPESIFDVWSLDEAKIKSLPFKEFLEHYSIEGR
jgi:hypothetical protein